MHSRLFDLSLAVHLRACVYVGFDEKGDTDLYATAPMHAKLISAHFPF